MPLKIRDRSCHIELNVLQCFLNLCSLNRPSAEARRNKGRPKFNTIQYLLSTEAFYLSKYESILFDSLFPIVSISCDVGRDSMTKISEIFDLRRLIKMNMEIWIKLYVRIGEFV